MDKTKSFFIEVLENGFVVKEGSRKSAIEKYITVNDMVSHELTEMLKVLQSSGTHNVAITITLSQNVPQIGTR